MRCQIVQCARLVLLLGVTYGAAARAEAQQAPRRSLQAFFYSDGRRIDVTIALDSIALIPADSVQAERAREVAERVALRFARAVPEGMIMLTTRDTLDRPGLVRRARELRAALGPGARAGLVLRTAPGAAPFFLTDEFIAQFNPGVDRTAIDALNAANDVQLVSGNPFVPNQYLLRVTPAARLDALEMANRYHEDALTVYAHPDFVNARELRGRQDAPPEAGPHRAGGTRVQPVIPNDPLFPSQWHLDNTGQGGGTVDADIDAPEAWDITLGIAAVRIAVLDVGFDLTHPDLTPNLWTNPGEIAGNGVDDDGNGVVDDVNGWDFTGCDANPAAGCGDNTPAGGNHGTAVAGSAAARGNNALGVSGSCPNCTWIAIRIGMFSGSFSDALAFGYAQQLGAEVITNSWGYPIGTPATTAVVNAINGASAAGAVVLFAMNNPNVNDCTGATPDISSLASVIAVSRATNRDRFDFSGFGNCMDLLAPSAGLTTVSSGRGTLWGTTTDVQGTPGYNNTSTSPSCPSTEPAPPPATARDYTLCFNGTSFATPVTAGVAGLIRSANAALTNVQVQRLLQDAADKVEPSTGAYGDNTGFSAPATGNATHGWGRVNAFEAVRIAAPAALGGRGGVDAFLRDNRLDWGNTQQPSNTTFEATRGFIGHWQSQDIKVDAPPYEPAPTAGSFDAFVDQTPSAAAGDVNRVYVRVRNRGPVTAASVTVKLHWTQFGTALPALPADFWTAFPANSTDPGNQWTALQCSTGGFTCTIANLGYSGASVATTPGDAAQIVRFDFPAPPIDPMRPNHFCLVGMIDSPSDRILPLSRPTQPSDFVVDWLTPNDNNVTHRNYHDLTTTRSSRFSERFYVRNPYDVPIRARLALQVPGEWIVRLDTFPAGQAFALGPGQAVLVTAQIQTTGVGSEGEVSVVQERVDVIPPAVMGGLTWYFRATPTPGGAGPVRRALSLHAGVAVPFATFANAVDPGPTVNLDAIFPLSSRLAVDLRGGVSRFAGTGGATDVDIWDVAANLKWIATVSTPWVFVNAGVGAYRVGSADWVGGFNVGAGIGRRLGANLDAEITINYQRAFTPGPDVTFGKAQLGLIWSP